jgi:four helix bundle protein
MATARRYEDLIVWQLAHALQREVFALTESGPVSRDFKFCNQIREASSSGPRNIAEGFGRFNPVDFARFLEIAKGSLMETHNHARDGFERGYFTEEQRERLCRLAGRAIKAAIPLIRYLQSCAAARKRTRKRLSNE